MTADGSSVRRFAAEPWDAPDPRAGDSPAADHTSTARRLVGGYAAGTCDPRRLTLRLVEAGVLDGPAFAADPTGTYARVRAALAPLDAAVALVAKDCAFDYAHRLCARCAQRQDAVHDAVVAAADAVVRDIPQRGVS